MKKLVLAAVLVAGIFPALTTPSHAEIDNPWEIHTDEENPFSEDSLKIYAGSIWIGGLRGVVLTCTEYREITDFDIGESEEGEKVPVGIAVDGKVIATMDDAEVVRLTSGKIGLRAKITADQRKAIGEALKTAKKAIHLKGAYDGGQKITARGSTAAGQALLSKCSK